MQKREDGPTSFHAKTAEGPVPQSILNAIDSDREQRKEYLRERDAIARRSAEALKSVERVTKAWADSDAAKRLKDPSNISYSSIDRVVWAYLKESAGKDGLVIRPSADPVAPPTPPVQLGSPDGGQYQYDFIAAEGTGDLLRDSLLIGFFAPWIFKNVGWSELTKAATVSRQFKFGFSTNLAPSDGLYEVRAAVVAAGKTGLYADPANEQNSASVGIRAGVANANEDVFVTENLLIKSGTKVNDISDFANMAIVSRIVELQGGQPLGFTVGISAWASALGAHSNAVINMYQGVGYVGCIGATIERIGPLT